LAAGDILVVGAREHNLKDITVRVPRDSLTVVTGLSGSGKSSLAFDTIYAEGQRRYVESLSAYARQFLGLMEKPDVDRIEGLSPAVAIEQRTSGRNPRSTVATVTEIYDYLRVLFARAGEPHCPDCGRPIAAQTISQMTDAVLALPEGTRARVLAPVVRGRKGGHRDLLDDLRKQGYVRVRVDGRDRDLDEEIELDKRRKHEISVVVDRLVLRGDVRTRLADSLETATRLASGTVVIDAGSAGTHVFSEALACAECGVSYDPPEPRSFSFNSPYGACPDCGGLGTRLSIDPNRVVPDPDKSVLEGAIASLGTSTESWGFTRLKAVADHYGFGLDVPWRKLAKRFQRAMMYGSGTTAIRTTFNGNAISGEFTRPYEGVISNLQRRYRQTRSSGIREWIEGFMSRKPCTTCGGARLRPEALAVTVGGMHISQVTALSVKAAQEWVSNLKLDTRRRAIARQVLKELGQRLSFLIDVGLDYLNLDRGAGTLSGGEAQRIRLATQIGSRLVGVLYILDEPSIGLHQRDNRRLLDTLCSLRDLGNTVIVVEHDRETIETADYVVDLGPGAGRKGGHVVASGRPDAIKRSRESLTGLYLAGRRSIAVPESRREPRGDFLTVVGASGNNLKKIDVRFPLGVLIGVTGVSGSGKSTLVNETLHRALARQLSGSRDEPLAFRALRGVRQVDKVIAIDQSPIGRTPRSNPATYTGVFTPIRELFASLPESKTRGYRPGRFSFNVKGGRCEACEGDGVLRIEMHFLPDVYVPCDECGGKRFNRETLEVRYKGASIADVLDMTVHEALIFFSNIPRVKRILQTLSDVGLGYVHLGQPATTLSGGEAQRVKLSTELSKRATGNTLYILDEPTTGLHFEDIKRLLSVLDELVERGNTVVVIEHNLDVVKTCDYLIDLGPEGGDDGGRVVAAGTPEEVARVEGSYTGRFLKNVLDGSGPSRAERRAS
jgi:excinuclease ABC subunit A